jgi:hypothetical protein
LNKKTRKNHDLTNCIVEKLYKVAENPSTKFRKYTIGFDANFMKYLRRFLGYRAFNFVIRKKVLKK